MTDLNKTQGVGALKKGKHGVIAIVALIYCEVAAGAFGVEEMISGCGPGMTVIVLIGMAMFWGLPDCFRLAEMSSVMPNEGGYYYYAKKMYGEFWGFQVGWWVAISFYLCGATYIVLAVDYLQNLIDLSPGAALAVKFAIVIFFTIVNLMGIREVSVLGIIFSVIILIAFAAVTVVGFAHWEYNPFTPVVPPGESVVSSLGSSIGIGVWMYCGWGVVTVIAGEIEDRTVLSRSLRIAVPLIAVTYLLPTIAGLAAIGEWENWTTVGSEGVGFSTVLERFAGPSAIVIFVAVAIIGQLAQFNTNTAGSSRTLFVMSDDHLFPRKFLTNVSKKRGVPYVGILSVSLVTILMMQMTFQALVLIQVIPIFALGVICSLIFLKARRIIPLEERKRSGIFTVGMGKLGVFIVVFCPAAVSILAFYLNGTDYFLFGLIFLLSGIVLYWIIKPVCGGMTVDDEEHFPVNPKTKLAYGDYFRIRDFLVIIGITSISGSFILDLIEGSWGAEYYLEEYGNGLLSDFNGMLITMLAGGALCLIAAVAMNIAGKKKDRKMTMPVYKPGENIVGD